MAKIPRTRFLHLLLYNPGRLSL